ncbi:hypothetical protein CH063_12547 [Colletotrichum higginsianum]|uniref:Uncharacterized protein n=1 Tax=Colletotrichum higginsianum (strain IMI 349063) TaxID=759273 RepID=H1VQT5_COLHI|nr:hypothetical protein CH063_12547 [Colletotrichum higginsianum]
MVQGAAENFLPSSGTQFSNVSGIYQSTPCNGINYTATTAFGRGPIADMREDPTHYKNLSAMADEMKRASGPSTRH